jgi:predicted Zn-dependent protease
MESLTTVDKCFASVAQKFDAIRFSRAQEADADILGVDLAIKSGYDGDGLVHFFERLEKTGGGENKLLALLSDHPLDSERIAAVKKEIARLHSKPQ